MFYCSQPNKPLTTLAKKDLEDLIAQASYGDKIETVRATQTVRFFFHFFQRSINVLLIMCMLLFWLYTVVLRL